MDLKERLELNPMTTIDTALRILAHTSVVTLGLELSENFSQAHDRYKQLIYSTIFSNDTITKELYSTIELPDGTIDSIEVESGHGFSTVVSNVNILQLLDKYNEILKKYGKEPIALTMQSINESSEAGNEAVLRANQIAKIKCQVIAQTLWLLNPTMTTTEMTKHYAILEFGDGKNYPGKNTLSDWLREVDPRPDNAKTGRSKSDS